MDAGEGSVWSLGWCSPGWLGKGRVLCRLVLSWVAGNALHIWPHVLSILLYSYPGNALHRVCLPWLPLRAGKNTIIL